MRFAPSEVQSPLHPQPFGKAKGALTYQQTNQSADVGSGRADYFGHGSAGSGKMCEDVTQLEYGSREDFVRGLDDILAKPTITMEHEFGREYEWSDWKGATYNLKKEWEYVKGAARCTEGCTAGTRDANNHGKTPDDLRRLIRERLQSLVREINTSGKLAPDRLIKVRALLVEAWIVFSNPVSIPSEPNSSPATEDLTLLIELLEAFTEGDEKDVCMEWLCI